MNKKLLTMGITVMVLILGCFFVTTPYTAIPFPERIYEKRYNFLFLSCGHTTNHPFDHSTIQPIHE